jgi:hypothetical protein
MESNKILFFFAIIILIMTLSNMIMVLINSNLIKSTTGNAAIAYVNITIENNIVIGLNRSSINWGPGLIDYGEHNATLYTNGDNDGVVQRGNWSGVNVRSLTVDNIGNINCSLNIKTLKDAHDMFNSSSFSNEEYKIKVSESSSGTCNSGNLDTFIDANKSNGGTRYCDNFNSGNAINRVNVDILFTIPSDSNNLGNQSDIITFIGNSI